MTDSQKKKVWIVAESTFEWYTIKHVCGSKETALKRWNELRDDMIKENQDMVEYEKREGYDAGEWQEDIIKLQNLKPGESCHCDYPDLKEWEVEV